MTQRYGPVRDSGARLEWAIEDTHELELAVPGLVLDTELSYTDLPDVARYSWPTRLLLRGWGHVTVLRRLGRLLRYRFGRETG